MRVVALSDIHSRVPEDVPECDLLLVAGDLTLEHEPRDEVRFVRHEFIPWLHRQKAKDHAVIAGNHDFSAQRGQWGGLDMNYLQDESQAIQGAVVHGCPWSNQFGSWAFMGGEDKLAERIARADPRTEILLTHGPPYGRGDLTYYGGESVGSKAFLLHADTALPGLRLHVYGHIHEARGEHEDAPHVSANVSYVDLQYRPWGLPFHVFDLA